jgi:hypothetical protein
MVFVGVDLRSRKVTSQNFVLRMSLFERLYQRVDCQRSRGALPNQRALRTYHSYYH